MLEEIIAMQHYRLTLEAERTTPMLTRDQNDLLAFLADSAYELAARAHTKNAQELRGLMNEAEELMTIRANLLNTHWNKANQFELPFEMKKAA